MSKATEIINRMCELQKELSELQNRLEVRDADMCQLAYIDHKTGATKIGAGLSQANTLKVARWLVDMLGEPDR